MGTHRSRHNKGRKPFYKDHRLVARDLIARPAYPGMRYDGGNGWYDTRTWWSDAEKFKLEVLCEADQSVDESADALGRSPTSIAHYARDRGITLPYDWAKLIAPKTQKKKIIAPKSNLAYPFINKPRPEHSDLLEVNALIPRSVPDNMRADMCQEIMLALLEGRTTLEALRSRDKSGAYFIRKFYHENFEQDGHALSFSAAGNDERSYDEIAAAIAAKDWYHEKRIEAQAGIIPPRMYTQPNQFEAAWRDQVGRVQLSMHEIGQFLSFEEVEDMLDTDVPTHVGS